MNYEIDDIIVKLFKKTILIILNYNKQICSEQLDLIQRKKLSIALNDNKFRTTYVKYDKIHFNLSFLKYMWAMIYTLFNFSHKIQKLESTNKWDGNALALPGAHNIFFMKKWANILKMNNIPWFENYPSPDAEDEESKVSNTTFHFAIAFIYFHEYSHIVLEHKSSVTESVLLAQEKEADINALSIMISENDDDYKKRSIGKGICLSMIIQLFIIDEIAMISSKTHPDIDHRIYNALDYLNIKERYPSEYMKRLVSLGCNFFIIENDYKLKVQRHENSDSLNESIMQFFDDIKKELSDYKK